MAITKEKALRVEGENIRVSNLDKVLFPAGQFTKAALIQFYVDASEFLLPHLKNRPVTLKRLPDGVNGPAFWEKDVPSFAPDWIQTTPVPRKLESGEIHYLLINNVRTLVWCASIATIELHPFLHRAENIQQPTSVVFDLDPGEGATTLNCAEVAFLLRKKLAQQQLQVFPKMSGSKGIQVYVPLNIPVSYSSTKPFARRIAEELAREHPRLIVSEMAKTVRVGKVFIDWSQNIETKTTVAVYSIRAKHQKPFVSMPVTWEELKRACDKRDDRHLRFEPDQALKRLSNLGDLYAPVLKLKQHLPAEFAAAEIQQPRSKRLRASRKLETYAAKRNFTRTREPEPITPRRSQQGGKRRFVIQKHDASHLHYDLRLEMSDTLKSWAVPKGLPTTVGERRSAFGVEDHPIEYLSFEGVIPQGEYGAGTVMVWDIGTYEMVEGNYWKGYLRVFINGVKLKGEWLLEKKTEGEKPLWLITKAARSIRLRRGAEDRSALTGRSMAQITAARDATWSSRAERQQSGSPRKTEAAGAPAFVPPMLAIKVDVLPQGRDLLYEWKWDGYRTIAVKHGGSIKLYSRKGRDQTASFPSVADALRTIQADRAVLDGEIIAISDKGEVSFQHLQNRGTLPRGWHILFCAFDLLQLEEQDLRKATLEERKQKLLWIIAHTGVLFSSELTGTAKSLIQLGRKSKREGIVAKERKSIYQSGARSRAWRKLQLKPQQEFVIGGYRPQGRSGLELLLVGYYKDGKFLYAGKVRIGLDPFNRKDLFARLQPLRQKSCPFANLPNSRSDHFGESVTAEEMQDYVWVKPLVVAQVKFAEWTKGNVLRHAEYLGLREDKEPKEIIRE